MKLTIEKNWMKYAQLLLFNNSQCHVSFLKDDYFEADFPSLFMQIKDIDVMNI